MKKIKKYLLVALSIVILLFVAWFVYHLFIQNATFPKDQRNTLEKIRGHTLIIGISESEPWTIIEDGEYSGIETEIVKRFADSIGADVEFVQGSESGLVEKLKKGQVDLVISGFTKKTIWEKEASPANPYYANRVFLVRKGENAFLAELEKYFIEHTSEIHSIAAKYLKK